MKALSLFLTLIALLPSLAPAQDALPPVIERYEQILLRSPGPGAAFDKVYTHFTESEGLEGLAARWQTAFDAAETDAGKSAYALLSGLLAERRGQPDEALAHYGKAAQLAPENPASQMLLGKLEAIEGRLDEAITAYTKALDLELGPAERLEVFRQLARAQERNVQPEEAVATWQRLVAESPSDPFVLEEAAEALLYAENYDDATALYEKLLELTEGDAFQQVTFRIQLARIQENQGNTGNALTIYEKALGDTSQSSWLSREVRARIESIYRRQDDIPGLVTYYEGWLEKHEGDLDAALALADALVELNRRDDAITWLEKASAWAPDRDEIRFLLATRLTEAGRLEAAEELLDQLRALRPEKVEYAIQLGEVQWQRFEKNDQDTTARKRALETWAAIAPEDTADAAIVSVLADIFYDHRLRDEALAQLERASVLEPGVHDYRERWAKLLLEMKRPEEAWTVLRGMVEGDRETAGNHLRLARIQHRHAKTDDALASIESGLALTDAGGNSGDADRFDLLSLQWQILAESQDWEKAEALFQPLVDAAPNDYFVEEIERRQVQALRELNRAGEVFTALNDRLGAGDPDNPLTEVELRLLARLALHLSAYETAETALAEGRKRFDQSIVLAQLDAAFQREREDPAATAKALRRLITLDPNRKTDWLQQIARVWLNAGDRGRALNTAQELIDASPARPESYLFYADIANAVDDAEQVIAKLEQALRLSDDKRDLHLRLARIYSDRGLSADARRQYDLAFEAAEETADKLRLTRPLAEAYFRDDALAELIRTFRSRQAAEQDGWRYALYLAEIFTSVEDYGSARQELSKALAARPKDEQLLRRIIDLAEREGNQTERLRYLRVLADAAPRLQNIADYIEALLRSGDGRDEALRLARKHREEFLANSFAWSRLSDQFISAGAVDDLAAIIREEIAGGASVTSAGLALAETFMVKSEWAQAEEILWELFSLTDDYSMPAPPAAKPGSSIPVPPMDIYAGMRRAMMSPAMRRVQQLYEVRGRAQNLIQGQGGGYTVRYRMSPGSGSGSGSQQAKGPDIDALRDTALVYLAAIAVQKGKAQEFLDNLAKRWDDLGRPFEDKLVSYAALHDAESVARLVSEHFADDATADPETDQVILIAVSTILSDLDDIAGTGTLEKLKGLQEAALDRILSARETSTFEDQLMRVQLLAASSDGNYDPKAQEKLLRELFDAADPENPDHYLSCLGLSLHLGNGAHVDEALDGILQAREKGKSLSSAFEATVKYLVPQLFAIANAAETDADAEAAARTFGKAFTLTIPERVPAAALTGRSHYPTGYRREPPPNTLPETRFFDADLIRNYASSLGQRGTPAGDGEKDDAPLIKPALARIVVALTETTEPPHDLYPKLLRLHLLWLENKREEAAALASKWLGDSPDDELILFLAGIQGELKDYENALASLKRVRARFGPVFIRTQSTILDYAMKLEDRESARDAALKLVNLRLPASDRDLLLGHLRELGLTEQAEKIAQRTGSTSSRSSSSSQGRTLHDAMNDARRKKDNDEALAKARQILALSPFNSANSNIGYYSDEAIETFKEAGKLIELVNELREQVALSPDSQKLNFYLAEAMKIRPIAKAAPAVTEELKEVAFPCWLKLEHKNPSVIAWHSSDGKNWELLGESKFSGGTKKPMIGFFATGGALPKDQFKATLSQIKFLNGTPQPGGDGSDGWRVHRMAYQPVTGPRQPLAPIPGGTAELTAAPGGLDLIGDGLDFHCRLLSPDASFVARVDAIDDPTGRARVGLMLRNGGDPSAPRAALHLDAEGTLTFHARPSATQHVPLYEKLVAMRPDDFEMRAKLATAYSNYGLKTRGFELMEEMLAGDMTKVIREARDELIAFYREQDNLERLVEVMLAWTPPKATSANYNTYHEISYAYYRIGYELRRAKKLNLALKVWEKGIAADVSGQYYTDEMFEGSAEVYLELGNKKKFYELISKMIFPQEPEEADPKKTAAAGNEPSPTLLGFRQHVAQPSYRRTRPWYGSLSYYSDGRVNSDAIGLLEKAVEAKFGDRILKRVAAELKKMADQEDDGDAGRITLNMKSLEAMTRIVMQDEKGISLLEEIGPQLGVASNDAGHARIFAQQLLEWEGHAGAAVPLLESALKQAKATNRMSVRSYSGISVYHQLAQAAEKSDQTELQHKTLLEFAELLESKRSEVISNDFSSFSLPHNAAAMLLDLDDIETAHKLVKLSRAAMEVSRYGNSSSYRRKQDELEKRIAEMTGEFQPPQVLAWILPSTVTADDSGKVTLQWAVTEANTSADDTKRARFQLTSPADAPANQKFAIEIHYGPAPDAMKVVATIDANELEGIARLDLPDGPGFLRAETKQRVAAGEIDDLTDPLAKIAAELSIPSLTVPVFVGENLLENPSINGPDVATGKAAPGWPQGWPETTPEIALSHNEIGFLDQMITVLEVKDERRWVHLYAEPIPWNAGDTYHLSAWTRGHGDEGATLIAVNCVDAEGKTLSSLQLPATLGEEGWFYAVAVLKQDPKQPYELKIPAKTAWLVPSVGAWKKGEFAQLFLGRVDPAKPPKAPKPPAAP